MDTLRMITAAEAKALRTPPEEEAQAECRQYLKRLDPLVREAARTGNFVTMPVNDQSHCWPWTRSFIEKELEALGYKLGYIGSDDGTLLEVRW